MMRMREIKRKTSVVSRLFYGHTRGKTVRKCRICRCYKKRQGTAENELKWITLEYARMTSENTS